MKVYVVLCDVGDTIQVARGNPKDDKDGEWIELSREELISELRRLNLLGELVKLSKEDCGSADRFWVEEVEV